MDQHDKGEGSYQPVSGTFVMDASLATLTRRFERCSDASHERLQFSTPKTAHGLSIVFDGSVCDQKEQKRVCFIFEPNGETSSTVTKGVRDQNVVLCCLRKMERVGFVSIPDSIEELCDLCFSRCSSLSRVTFGAFSLLKRIGTMTFMRCSLHGIHTPASVALVAMFAICVLRLFSPRH